MCSRIIGEKIRRLDLRPHFFPIGRFLMLHLLGIVMAIPGLIPACLAKGERITAHKHLGAVLIKAVTLEQHGGVTRALVFRAAAKQGVMLAAAAGIGVFPHSRAALHVLNKTFDVNRNNASNVM